MLAKAGDMGDPGLIPGSGRSLKVGNGNPIQYSCLENSTNRVVWQATVQKVGHDWAQHRVDMPVCLRKNQSFYCFYDDFLSVCSVPS